MFDADMYARNVSNAGIKHGVWHISLRNTFNVKKYSYKDFLDNWNWNIM